MLLTKFLALASSFYTKRCQLMDSTTIASACHSTVLTFLGVRSCQSFEGKLEFLLDGTGTAHDKSATAL